MNHNETRALWISIGAAIFAVFLVYSYTQEKSAALLQTHGQERTVVIASSDIHEMQTIDDSMLQIVEQPAKFTQPNALTNPEDAIGLVALAPIKKGEQILPNKIIEPSPTTGLSLQVTPGKRAITIPVDEMRGVAKLLKPGDRIDLIAAVDVGSGTNQKRQVKTLMQNVPILATGLKIVNELPRIYEKSGQQNFIKNIRDDTTFSSITIEANPQEAQNLIYILSTSPSSLFMTLRHPSDQQNKYRMGRSDASSVLGGVRTKALRNSLVRKPTATIPTKVPSTQPIKTPKRKKRAKPRAKSPFVDL